MRKHLNEVDDLKKRYDLELVSRDNQIEGLRKEMESLRVDIEGGRAQVQQFKITINTMNAAGFAMESELGIVKNKLTGNRVF